MVLIGAASAVGVATGLLIVALAIRGAPPTPPARQRWDVRDRDPRLVRLAAAVVVGVVTQLVTGRPAAALIAGVAVWVAPGMVRRVRADTDEVARTEAVAAWTEMLRDTLAAAAGLEEAIAASAQAAPEPIRGEVARLVRSLERERLAPALERFAEEVANPAADLVVAALLTAARREARDLVPLLGALATSARAEAEMRLRVHVSRARVRTAARVVTGTLGLFAGGLIIFNRAYLAPYATPEGQIVLVVVAAIFVGGWLLMDRMARIEGPPRFFGAEPAAGEQTP